MKKIDLNCDLGEWRSDNGPETDQLIMPFISSCNIACGGHIGDELSMRKTVELAMSHGVAIGAHPSYPDRQGFGRRRMELPNGELERALRDQILSLKAIVEEMGGRLHHIKPHGALYNTAGIDRETADLIIQVILKTVPGIKVYGQPGLKFEEAVIGSGLHFVGEVFADRAYEEDLRLRSRDLNGAVLHEEEAVLAQVESMVLKGKVRTFSGKVKTIQADTICLHSDTKGSAELARKIYEYLVLQDVQIHPA